MEKQRLDKLIAGQRNLSRSVVRTGIRRGGALVNGTVCRDFSTIVDAETDEIVYEGQPIGYQKYRYLMMNKPAGVLSASNDKSRETVIDLVPESLRRPGLFPVGRLDKDTTGLLLITDDGTFAHECIAPKKHVDKTYLCELDGPVTEEMTEQFHLGVTLADGTLCKPALLENAGECLARVTLREGKYHQIKRMFGTVGLGVVHLHRESIGELSLPPDLEPGKCVEMTENQQKMALKKARCIF